MSTTIYINNDNLQIINKNGKNYQYESVALEEGTILNGVITNPNEIIHQLKARKKKIKKVTLVVGSSDVLVERMIVSKTKKRNLLGYVKKELVVDEDQEYVYDYNILRNENGKYHILGYAVPKELVEDFMEVFKLAEIKINRIDVSINCVIKYLQKSKILSGKTYLMNIVSGSTLLIVFMEKGMYKFTTRMRMMHETDSEGYLPELKKKLEERLEYCYERYESLKGDMEAYYIGLDDEQMDIIKDSLLESGEELSVKSYKELNRDMSYVYPLMAEIVNKDDVNFRKIHKVVIDEPHSKKATIIMNGVIILVVLGFLGYTINLNQKNQEMDASIAALEKYVNAKEAENLEDGGSNLGSNEVINQIGQYTQISEQVADSQKLSMDLLEQLYSEVDMQVFTYIEQDDSVFINGNMSSYSALTDFVSALRSSGYFTEQYYKGYSVVSNAYNFNIEAVLNLSESGVAAND